ncbi:hypothetical protein J2Z44_002495 [Clostridium punense]|uniref:ABC transporter permease n=1 Tax=Clostridium punense TaxID=1054297 RepID=A0ABS4K4H1_9CLOT|nr:MULTISPECIES: hypothetical protein [Clostridium]EQB86312.1 hypothetical protein M918_15350 [Clostridium sp. BL8]MBP2022672.1 hypothetical protein [Clostridium punense]
MNNLKAFRNILKLDLIHGFNFYKKKLILFLVIIIILNIGNIVAVRNYQGNLIDLFFIMYKDVKFDPTALDIPINWLIINVFVIFILGDFISENLKRDSNYILLRSKKILLYWLSKCTWIVVNVLLIYLVVMGLTYLLGGVSLGFNLESSKFIKEVLVMEVPHLNILMWLVITYIFTSLALVLFQAIISIALNSRYAFLATTIILTMPIWWNNKFLVAIHSMILRHDYFNNEIGLSIAFSLVYTIGISVILMGLGYKLVEHKDFI